MINHCHRSNDEAASGNYSAAELASEGFTLVFHSRLYSAECWLWVFWSYSESYSESYSQSYIESYSESCRPVMRLIVDSTEVRLTAVVIPVGTTAGWAVDDSSSNLALLNALSVYVMCRIAEWQLVHLLPVYSTESFSCSTLNFKPFHSLPFKLTVHIGVEDDDNCAVSLSWKGTLLKFFCATCLIHWQIHCILLSVSVLPGVSNTV